VLFVVPVYAQLCVLLLCCGICRLWVYDHVDLRENIELEFFRIENKRKGTK
jgi:hypothetical protein